MKDKRILVTVVILSLFLSHSIAQTSNAKRILARILVNNTDTPVPFAFVANSQTGIGKETNEEGLFRIDIEPTDTLLFRCMGYEDNSWALSELNLECDTVNFTVTPKSYALQEINVLWFRSYAAFRHKVATMPMMETNEYTLPFSISVAPALAAKKAESGTFGYSFSLGRKSQSREERNYQELVNRERLYERYNQLTSRDNLQAFTEMEGAKLDSFIVFLRSKHNIDPRLNNYDMMVAINRVYEEFVALKEDTLIYNK